MGAYALLNRGAVFGSAQTTNMIDITISLLGRNFREVLLRIGAMMIYMIGTALTVYIINRTSINVQVISVILDMVIAFAIGFFPKDMNDIVALYPIFFIMAVQWNSFKGADGYISSSIFSTNNLKQATISFTEYLCDKDKSHLRKAKFYSTVLLFFHFGVVISYFSYRAIEIKGIWVCLIPLVIALLLINRENVSVRVKCLLQDFMI